MNPSHTHNVQAIYNEALKYAIETDNGQMCEAVWQLFNNTSISFVNGIK